MDQNKYFAINIDMDTFNSQVDYYGLPYINKYEDRMYEIVTPRILELLKKFNLKGTFFISGKDFIDMGKVCYWIKKIIEEGHEIANHSLNHRLGISSLPPKEIEYEIIKNHELIKEYFRFNCVGFRAPGYNISNIVIKLLKNNGYLYDSSLFPTSLAFLYKFYHWFLIFGKKKKISSGMSNIFSFFMPRQPYFINYHNYLYRFNNKNNYSFFEIPISTSTYFRLPFYFNFHLLLSEKLIKQIFKRLDSMFINYLLHAIDFIDYSKDRIDKRFASLLNIKIPLGQKVERFNAIINYFITNDYKNTLLIDFAKRSYANNIN